MLLVWFYSSFSIGDTGIAAAGKAWESAKLRLLEFQPILFSTGTGRFRRFSIISGWGLTHWTISCCTHPAFFFIVKCWDTFFSSKNVKENVNGHGLVVLILVNWQFQGIIKPVAGVYPVYHRTQWSQKGGSLFAEKTCRHGCHVWEKHVSPHFQTHEPLDIGEMCPWEVDKSFVEAKTRMSKLVSVSWYAWSWETLIINVDSCNDDQWCLIDTIIN